jgi:dTDP-4-amino-4,6-dideoxyglucose
VKRRIEDLAAFGGKAAFARPLHVAQLNLPPWEEVEASFRGIFARRYFANHGPLVRELEARFAGLTGAKHAVCVTNGTVALTVLAAALDLTGEVIVPAFTFPATAQALSWAGLTPVLCDVDPGTHMVSEETIAPRITARTSAVLAVHLWGRPCRPEALEAFAAARGLKLFFDACHSIGSSNEGRRMGTFGSGEAFSFHATKIVSGGEGGCVTTNDDAIAARLRTIRNFHPSETFAAVPTRMNGKMSEAQAAMALLGLDHLAGHAAANRRRYEAFRSGLAGIPGVSLLDYGAGQGDSYQYIVLEIDAGQSGVERDLFLELLAAENVLCRRHFSPGLHRTPPYSVGADAAGSFPGTDRLCGRLMQLPNSQSMSVADVDAVCGLIRSIQEHSAGIRRARA